MNRRHPERRPHPSSGYLAAYAEVRRSVAAARVDGRKRRGGPKPYAERAAIPSVRTGKLNRLQVGGVGVSLTLLLRATAGATQKRDKRRRSGGVGCPPLFTIVGAACGARSLAGRWQTGVGASGTGVPPRCK